ncbi:MAG: shikimate dehydrogenase [Acidimicrobiia bacterium]|nr:shikimate dehydrogenase [Acidimicrobiia bacterium]
MAGVIGDPVRHSRSPAIHNAAFRSCGLDWVFAGWEVGAGGGAAAVEAMRTLGLGGLSVTMPLKAEVAAAVDRCSGAATTLGAVNCVAVEGSELVGHNTDGAGFVASLRAEGIDPAGRRVVVLGAGGAARAVVAAMAEAGAESVTVVNRDEARGRRAAMLAGDRGRLGTTADVAGADLLVNATPVGMAGTPGLPVPAEVLEGVAAVADLVYQPLETELLTEARRAGVVAIDGLGMLVHQAAAAFELWTGRPAPVAVMRQAADTGASSVV